MHIVMCGLLFPSGNSFIALAKDLLREGYSFVLTEKLLCQDPLEQFFGHQRDATGSNNNPSMEQVLSYNRLHAVTKSMEVELSGNCSKRGKAIQITNEPLPKVKRTKKVPARYIQP